MFVHLYESIIFKEYISNYNLAINSVMSKKEDRLNNTLASFNFFKNNYSDDKLMKLAQGIHDKTIKQLEKFQ